MRSYCVLLPVIVALLAASGCTAQPRPTEPRREPITQDMDKEKPTVAEATLKAAIVTNKGTINLDLFASQTPMTVANFVNLAQRGYYDGLKFHRVIPDFMVQGGCPLGTGTGGPGYKFGDECKADLKHDTPGRLSMANAGPGTNGSQFFVTHVPTPWLDGKHTIFGSVVSAADQDVVNAIAGGDTIERVEIEGDTAPLMAQMADQVAAWNKVLDQQ